MRKAIKQAVLAGAKRIRTVARIAAVALLAVTLTTMLPAQATAKAAKTSLKSKPVAKKYKRMGLKVGKPVKKKSAKKKAARRSHSVHALANKKAVNVRKALPARSDRLHAPWKMASVAQPRITDPAVVVGAKLTRSEHLEPRAADTTCRHDGKLCGANDESTTSSEIGLPRAAKTACRRDGRIFLLADCGPDGASAPLAANSNTENRLRPD